MTTQGYAGLAQTLQAQNTNEYAGFALVRRVRRVTAHVCVNSHTDIHICTYLINQIYIFLFHIRGFNPAYPAYISTSHVNKGIEATQGLFQPCASLRD